MDHQLVVDAFKTIEVLHDLNTPTRTELDLSAFTRLCDWLDANSGDSVELERSRIAEGLRTASMLGKGPCVGTELLCKLLNDIQEGERDRRKLWQAFVALKSWTAAHSSQQLI